MSLSSEHRPYRPTKPTYVSWYLSNPHGNLGGSTSRRHRDLLATYAKHAEWSEPANPIPTLPTSTRRVADTRVLPSTRFRQAASKTKIRTTLRVSVTSWVDLNASAFKRITLGRLQIVVLSIELPVLVERLANRTNRFRASPPVPLVELELVQFSDFYLFAISQ